MRRHNTHMRVSNNFTQFASALFFVGSVALVACGGGSEEKAAAPDAAAPSRSSASGSTQGVHFDNADLDAYARGLRREIEAIRAAKARAADAKTPAERGDAYQATYESSTIPQGAEAAGVPTERYRAIREAVHDVFDTLDFQGKIDGPRSIDLSRASEEMKERLARDAFADLPEASASALRARMNDLVPIWIDYVNLTAVAG